jgi:beta-glucosidase
MKKLILFIGLFVAGPSFGQQYKTFSMWDYMLSIAQRVNDLVSRLRLEEKVRQMLNVAPTITTLGI